MTSPQRFTLVENALDSLEHAIVHLTEPDGLSLGDYKRVFLDLAHVAELLFKEKLRLIHPAFVLADVDKFPSTTARTVTAAGAVERLRKIGDIEFEEADESALKAIRDKRNEIEHYEFQLHENEASVVIGSILVFIFRFACDELGLDWADRRLSDPEWSKLNDYAAFFERQRAQVLEAIATSDLATLDCPSCRNTTFDIESELCLLCGHREDVLNCARCRDDYLESDAIFEHLGLCPRCEWEEEFAAATHEKY